jgi:hypothetical protein
MADHSDLGFVPTQQPNAHTDLGFTPAAAAAPQERSFLDSVANAGEKFWEWTGKPVALALGMGSGTPQEQAAKAREAQKQIVQGIMNEPARVRQELTNALDAFVAGNPRATLHHTLNAIPVVGAGIDQIAQEANKGEYSSAVGHTAALLAPAAAREVPAVAAVAREKMGPPLAAAADAIADKAKLQSTLNPVEQGAVDFLRQKEVPLTPGTITGNKYVKALQATTQNSPLGAGAAAEFNRGTEAGITRVAGDLAAEAHPEPVTPESVGAAVPAKLRKNIETLGIAEDEAYQDAWIGQGEPENTYEVPVRTIRKPVLDANGKPTGDIAEQTITKRVNMPVDVRDIKAMAKPIFDEMQWMPAAERASSAGFAALDKILKGDDYIPAWQAEKGLSGLKTMARLTNKSGVRDAGQGIAASLIPDLQDGIDAAVAKTGDVALQGLKRGRETHAHMMEVADLAEKLRDEPVQTFNQLTWQNDTGIDFLRQIQKQAPDQMPQVGRAFIQQLIDKASREGGFTKTRGILDRWNDLGPETKKILFPDPELRDSIGKFLKGADMVAQNPNPSGTALVQAANSVNPLRWVAGWLGSKAFFTPKGIAMLTEKLQTPVSTGEAAFNARKAAR